MSGNWSTILDSASLIWEARYRGQGPAERFGQLSPLYGNTDRLTWFMERWARAIRRHDARDAERMNAIVRELRAHAR